MQFADLEGRGVRRDPARSGSDSGSSRRLGAAGLTALIFFSVSGGPFGFEEAVDAGGSAWVLIGCLLVPLLWSVPEALMTAELSSAFPEAAGFGAWVNEAFGPYWAFSSGMLSWVSGVADNAVYPVLLLDYLEQPGIGLALGGAARWAFILGFTALFTYLTWRGLDLTGSLALALTILCLSPFAVFCGAALLSRSFDASHWLALRPIDEVDWRRLVNVLFWNFNYWDSSSAWAGNLKAPDTFPRAMRSAVLLVVLTYLLPTLAATAAAPPPAHAYCDGCFAALADEVAGGRWLGAWVVVAAASSCVGLFAAEMSSDSFQIMGMADRGQLPSALASRSAHGTPTLATLLSATGVVLLCGMSFEEILELENALYVLSEVLEFLAFLRLRAAQPDRARPFRAPVGDGWTAKLVFLPAAAFLLLVLALCSGRTLLLTLAAFLAASALYLLAGAARTRRWCAFKPVPPRWTTGRDPRCVRWLLRKAGAEAREPLLDEAEAQAMWDAAAGAAEGTGDGGAAGGAPA